jgi:hypothetical protein
MLSMGLMPIMIMFVANFLLSYGIMSNLMIDQFNHTYNHLNKIYMGLFMASLMGLLEVQIMPPVTNHLVAINFGFLFVMILMGIFIRKQTLINDNQFLKAMIEHHSAALLMAKQSMTTTQNPKIFKLTQNIIKTQTQEIQDMQSLLT